MLYGKGQGRYNQEYRELWDKLVPASGQASTVQGELVRVIGRLASEFYRNGNCNWDMGFRRFTNFLAKHLKDKKVFDAATLNQIEADIQELRVIAKDWVEDGEDVYDRITDRVVEWCQHYPEPIPREIDPKLKR
ncbi:hypothetical protein EON80_07370 [bacterium]|nr:MAG: hypothetical protein EON80_07370 [bacterium]